ncbi:MAG TPA: adenylate/guanylate cyclase domain-containing protein [Gaiellaceae bacterium]|jgi:predicted ATPase/class 3 adenylate cyclase
MISVVSATPQPSGTVTLVFTDIEGSTRLLDRIGPDAYRTVLTEHHAAVRDAFGRHAGYEVHAEGDEFFYAFPTASEAALAVQEALAALDGGPIRIRVGMHTGEPLVDGSKYLGLDVHRAARIMSAAHGGQVLLSRATRGLLDDGFPVRDLGEFRLKDLSAPQRLFQLGAGDFPQPRTLQRTNLPVSPTEFLGRERELADVVGQLRAGARLLTLTGPGGTGKTRLALQAAAETADDFPDGAWWVALAELRDPGTVLRHAARTLDVLEQPDRPLEDVLAETLGGKRMLLVLDNAEHLLPDAAAAIATLRDLDGPTVVVTSRERLQLSGEQVYRVPQLTPVDGLALFSARAAALDPAFDGNDAVAELCSRLDNLPLAIELAAARTTVLRPDQILERLSDRLDLLRGARDADPRQQTLRATIEWSFDGLSPEERDLACHFAVFAGGATLEAVEGVCGGDIDTLASLVDKSLLRHDGDRFWMLETIREYGTDQLLDGRLEDVIERHGAFFERFAAAGELGLRGPDGAMWLDLVEQELPNLREAMARALERGAGARALGIAAPLGRYWHARGASREGRRWLERALATGQLDDEARARGCLVAGGLAFFQGDMAPAEVALAEAADAARSAGEVFLEAQACAHLVWVAEERGNPTLGLAPLERSRALLSQLTDKWERSEVLLRLSGARSDDRDGRLTEDVVALKREIGDVIATSDSLNNVGWEALTRGDAAHAAAFLEEALAIARELRDTFRMTLAIGNLAHLAVMEKRYTEAVELSRECLLLCIAAGDKRGGEEVLLSLSAAVAGLDRDELSVQLDAIHRAVAADAGIVDDPMLVERLEPLISLARTRVGPERVSVLEKEIAAPSMELALELLDGSNLG